MIAGGREGKVGIAGLLTGGGKTFYTCRVGFACGNFIPAGQVASLVTNKGCRSRPGGQLRSRLSRWQHRKRQRANKP